MQKTIVKTINAPAPIGPYNQAVKTGGLLFISGQIAMNPHTNELVNEDLAAEATQVMKNLQGILTEAGIDFTHVIKTTIFLTDMAMFSIINEVYGKYFDENAPARETVAVSGLPRNVNVEISMIAAL